MPEATDGSFIMSGNSSLEEDTKTDQIAALHLEDLIGQLDIVDSHFASAEDLHPFNSYVLIGIMKACVTRLKLYSHRKDKYPFEQLRDPASPVYALTKRFEKQVQACQNYVHHRSPSTSVAISDGRKFVLDKFPLWQVEFWKALLGDAKLSSENQIELINNGSHLFVLQYLIHQNDHMKFLKIDGEVLKWLLIQLDKSAEHQEDVSHSSTAVAAGLCRLATVPSMKQHLLAVANASKGARAEIKSGGVLSSSVLSWLESRLTFIYRLSHQTNRSFDSSLAELYMLGYIILFPLCQLKGDCDIYRQALDWSQKYSVDGMCILANELASYDTFV